MTLRNNVMPVVWALLGLLLLMFGVVLVGYLLAYSPKIIAAVVGLVGLLSAVLLVSPQVALALAVVTCMFVVGPAESIGRVDRVFWASYLFTALLAVKALMARFGRMTQMPRWGATVPDPGARQPFTNVGMLVGALLAIGCFSTLYASSDAMQTMLATRDYLWMWGALALVVVTRMPSAHLTQVVRLLPWAVVLQVPLVVYQRYAVYVGKVRSWDAVVGLFGGNPDGGGASGSMGVFAVLMATYTVLRARAGLVSPWFAALVCAATVISVALAEVKIVPLISPILVVAMFGLRTTLHRPKVLLGLVLVALSAPLVLYGYWRTFEQGNQGRGTFERYVEVIVERNLDDRGNTLGSIEMGRVAALKFWWQKADFAGQPIESLAGHGIGATRIGFFAGDVARKYPFKIARSSFAVLLWELGLLGTLAVVALLLAAWRRAVTAETQWAMPDPELLCALRLSAGVMAASLLYLPYNTDIVGTPQTQLVVVLMCAVIWRARHLTHR
jgi:hypothetical protein